MAVRSRFKRSVQDTRVHRVVDVGSDHNLVVTKAKLKLNSTDKKQERTVRYEESKLRVPEIRQQLKLELRNRFSILQMSDRNDTVTDDHKNSDKSDPTTNVEQRWQKIKTA